MNRRLNLLWIASAFCLASGCAKSVPGSSGLGEPCLANADCAGGFVCAASKCELPANLGGCEPGRKRCNGADIERCQASGLGYDLVSTCATGCVAGACNPQVCSPGARRCDGDASQACTPAGDGWSLVQECPSHCNSTTGACTAPVCTPFATVCSADNLSVRTCDSFGASWTAAPCGAQQICDQGRCLSALCSPGQTRCAASGAAVEACNSLGDGWSTGLSCQFGCGQGQSGAACLAAACQPGGYRCAGNALEACLPDQTGYAFVSFCATGCDAAAGACSTPVCAPLARKCAADAAHVEVCADDGSAFVTLQPACPQGCAGGACVTSSAGCTPGDLRCNGDDAQLCAGVTGSPGVTSWSTLETCLAGCSSGACLPGGSCKSFALNSAVAAAPGDGQGSILLYSDAILGGDGEQIPDGLEFTIAASASDASRPQFLSSDADPAMPGLQVRSAGGRIRAVLASPVVASGSVVTTASASLSQGASCSGATTVTFAPPTAPQTTLVAEDFTDPARRNLAQTSADWDTTQGVLSASWPLAVGGGEDGPLVVGSGTYNLSTTYMPAFAVTGLSAQGVTVDGVPQGISGGDEVILWDAQGSASGSANAGSYEFLRVATVQGSQITFVGPVLGSYGAAADRDVATQRVVVQRVPHFSSLTVQSGATLTANHWSDGPGGLIFLRVGCPASHVQQAGVCDGVAIIQGEVNLDAAGYRGGTTSACAAPSTLTGCGEDQTGRAGNAGGGAGSGFCGGGYGTAGGSQNGCASPGQPYGLPLLGRIFLGAAGGGGFSGEQGGSGGGAIAIAAQAISLASKPFQSAGVQQGRVHADGWPGSGSSGAGAGGSVWLAAPELQVGSAAAGPPFASARGGGGAASGGLGRIRLDDQRGELAPGIPTACGRAQPACAPGATSGPSIGQSQIVFAAGASQFISAASLLVALGPADAIYRASASNSGQDFGPVAPGGSLKFVVAGSPAIGQKFQWQVQLAPPPGPPEEVLGLQWALTVLNAN